jgi:alpha-galactosidase
MLEGCGQPPVLVNNANGLSPTPPMGWNSWNSFMDGVSDALLRQIADAMVANGMRDAGYQYVNIDDGWALPQRVNGHLQPDPVKFPGGFKPVTDYLHARGLKFGIYADRGTATCVSHSPGSHGHETTDAADFAAWGVDYLKYDNCNPAFFSTQERDYRRMRDALAATGRPIVFSICAWKFKDWMPGMGNLWRTTDDIRDDWGTLVEIIDQNEKSASFSRPGQWNDPDMLVVGCSNIQDLQHNRAFDGASELVGSRGLTEEENRSHFGMWAIMAAPLIAGNDLSNMPDKIREILLNKEVIAVDQDPAGRQGVKVWDNGQGLCVYSKVLMGNNTRAVALFNRSEHSEAITAKWVDIGIPGGTATVRDLWKHVDMGTFSGGYKAYVPSHGLVLIKVAVTNTQ